MAIEYAPVYGVELRIARHLTEDEKPHYNPEYQNRILIGMETGIKLPYVDGEDMPNRPSDSQFNGCSNLAWIVNQDEWDYYLKLNKEREKAENARKLEYEISLLQERKAKAEAQKDLPTREEANRQIKEWNDLYNEGGEGYVPHIYTRKEYDYICQQLENLTEKAQVKTNL